MHMPAPRIHRNQGLQKRGTRSASNPYQGRMMPNRAYTARIANRAYGRTTCPLIKCSRERRSPICSINTSKRGFHVIFENTNNSNSGAKRGSVRTTLNEHGNDGLLHRGSGVGASRETSKPQCFGCSSSFLFPTRLQCNYRTAAFGHALYGDVGEKQSSRRLTASIGRGKFPSKKNKMTKMLVLWPQALKPWHY